MHFKEEIKDYSQNILLQLNFKERKLITKNLMELLQNSSSTLDANIRFVETIDNFPWTDSDLTHLLKVTKSDFIFLLFCDGRMIIAYSV